MIKNYDLIVFDWDGTLADSTEIIIDSIRTAADEIGLPMPARHEASSIIGLGLGEAIDTLFGDIGGSQFNELVARYGYHYKSKEHEIPLFYGASDAIPILAERGHLLAVATGKGRNGLNRALEKSGLSDYFHATRCVDECRSKPHPQMLLELMDELDVSPGRTLMIGDTSFDLLMAKNANVSSLAVTYGAHHLEDLISCGPIAYFDDFQELNKWIICNA